MAQVAIHDPRNSRMRLLVWPREHGAWGILFIPLLTGAVAGLIQESRWAQAGLFALAALSLFCLRTPIESLLGTTPMRAQSCEERRTVTLAAVSFSAISVLALISLFRNNPNRNLLLVGGAVAVAFLGQTLVRRLGRVGRMPAQLIGALGLTSTAAGAYCAVTLRLDPTAFSLWLANWLFAVNQILFVQTRIRGAKLSGLREKLIHGRTFLVAQLAMLLVVLLGWRYQALPALALLAFIPVLLRGLSWYFGPSRPLDVHRLGFTELAHALVFGAWLSVTMVFR